MWGSTVCIGGGSVPTPAAVPLKQAAKVPDSTNPGAAAADQLRRRMGLAAAILPQNALGSGMTGTSATAAKTTLGS